MTTSAPVGLFTPRFIVMCGFNFVVFLSAFQLLPTAPFQIRALGGSAVAAGLFLGFLTYSSAMSGPITGGIVDRVGKRRVLMISSLAIASMGISDQPSAQQAPQGWLLKAEDRVLRRDEGRLHS